tara:strand:+ start:345 stop:593 length:249 start_codon:yes stop_codon:yes gene_type:complete
MIEDNIELSSTQVFNIDQISEALGSGWELVRVKRYLDGVQINWKNGDASCMWRDELGEYVEILDKSKSWHPKVYAFHELSSL